MFRVTLSAIGLLISICGFVLFVIIAIGVWIARDEADRKTDELAQRADSAALVAERAISIVNDMIDRAEQDLVVARSMPPSDTAVNPILKLTVNKAADQLPGGVERARDAVVVASDTIVVLDAALDVVLDRPGDRAAFGIPASEIESAKQHLNITAAELRKAKTIFGVRLSPLRQDEIDAVQQALDHARRFSHELKRVVDHIRQQIEQARTKTQLWTLRVAISTTFLSSLAAVGQFFMGRTCWQGLRTQPAAMNPILADRRG